MVSVNGVITSEELEIYAKFSITAGSRLAGEGYSNIDAQYTDAGLDSTISVAEGRYELETGNDSISSTSSNAIKTMILIIAKNLMDEQMIDDGNKTKPKNFVSTHDLIKRLFDKKSKGNLTLFNNTTEW